MAHPKKNDDRLMAALTAKVGQIVTGDDQPSAPTTKAARPRKSTTAAVAYMRCSGLGQAGGDTWDRQIESISRYAKGAGLTIADCDWFRDAGISGTKDLENRPGLAAVLDRVENNGVRVVLVENATRFARDLMVQEIALAKFRDAGCRVIAADGGVDLIDESDTDPTRVLIRQVLGAVSQWQKCVDVLKLRAARNRKSKEGGRRIEGRKPFGSRAGEAETLVRIKELHRKPHGGTRRSLQEIADTLNAEGRPTRSGKPWTKSSLHQIIGRGLKSAIDQPVS